MSEKVDGRAAFLWQREKAIQALRDGNTAREIADHVGVHRATIERWAKEEGIELKRGPRRVTPENASLKVRPGIVDAPFQWLWDHAMNELRRGSQTVEEVAEMSGLPASALRLKCQVEGFDPRERRKSSVRAHWVTSFNEQCLQKSAAHQTKKKSARAHRKWVRKQVEDARDRMEAVQ